MHFIKMTWMNLEDVFSLILVLFCQQEFCHKKALIPIWGTYKILHEADYSCNNSKF